jgi:ribosomal-protein-alanine N-acetyltransferase
LAFLRSGNPTKTATGIHGNKIFLRAPSPADYGPWAELRFQSRRFLAPWEPVWPSDELTRLGFRRRLRRHQREIRDGTGYPFFVFLADEPTIVGGITLSHVQRGVTQSAALGYWMGERFARKGLMTDAVRTILSYAFDTLRLHRIEAACLPNNSASIGLLENTGFSREGYARSFLCIDGRWQDHLLYAIVAGEHRSVT